MEYVNDVLGELTNVLIAKNLSTSTDSYYLYGAGLISRGGVSEQNREYYLEDGTGNIRYLTDDSGNIVESYSYDPYGNPLSGDTPTDFAYKGEQIDT